MPSLLLDAFRRLRRFDPLGLSTALSLAGWCVLPWVTAWSRSPGSIRDIDPDCRAQLATAWDVGGEAIPSPGIDPDCLVILQDALPAASHTPDPEASALQLAGLCFGIAAWGIRMRVPSVVRGRTLAGGVLVVGHIAGAAGHLGLWQMQGAALWFVLAAAWVVAEAWFSVVDVHTVLSSVLARLPVEDEAIFTARQDELRDRMSKATQSLVIRPEELVAALWGPHRFVRWIVNEVPKGVNIVDSVALDAGTQQVCEELALQLEGSGYLDRLKTALKNDPLAAPFQAAVQWPAL